MATKPDREEHTVRADESRTNLDLYDNKTYSPQANTLKRSLWYIINILFFINPLNPFSGSKTFLLRCFGAGIGRKVTIKPNVNIKHPWLLEIGDYTWIGEGVWIDNLVMVRIGRNVCVSQGAMLLTGNHDYKKPTFDLITGEIVLQDGVWVGARAVVCPGITCQSHSVLAVNSVATQDLQPFSIYQGNPAAKMRERKMRGQPKTVSES